MSRSYIALFGLVSGFLLILLAQSNIVETRTPLYSLISVLAYSVIGSSILFGAYKVLDWILPSNVEEEIFEKKNIAAAIFKGLFLLGIAIIIAAVIVSP